FEIKNPKLWWPNGLGEQNLYTVEIQLLKDNAILSQKSSRIGLRTIEVVQEPDSIGKSFYFKVNGHPVFMKGANYIPQDIFVDRVTPDHYKKLIQSAVDANMNMIRVWGGGIYEKDILYDLCDEKGILVWQDFMFSCSMYPVDNEFLENVRQEAINNVKRLRNHPCIAMWCGNNECLSGWKRWGWKDWVIKKQGQEVADIIWHGYDTLFHKIIPSVINELDNDRLYWCSSPASGFNEPENWKSGDTHYWGVWWGKEPFSTYTERIGRFMSEFGFQSFPEFGTVKKYSIKEDWDIYSPVMKSHQRSTIGNETIAEYMDRDYKKPKNFEMFLYVNHVLQAEGIRTGIEAQRRSMPHCMGSLYWQIDDCWPVASWSSIDYYGKWKALHYFAKKAFENVLVSPVIENEKIKIFVVSDKLEDLQAKLKLLVIDFEGNIINELEKEINIKQNSSNIYFEEEIAKITKNSKQENSLILVSVFDSTNQILSDNIMYFKSPKDLELPEPTIVTEIETQKNGFSIKLKTDKLAKNVYLTIPDMDGFFSDNYFDLLPGYEKTVEFNCDSKLTLDEFKEKLNVVSLVDSY
ncbi:MAG: glycoside hydrolase family 2 protein, partial [Bacteroidales bacterium]|nr:glycoside hydrolase family 2 protein [Bacteroidales bacterium]